MAGFRDLADRLAELEGLPSRITREVADGFNVLLKQEFASETDPYGRGWKALKETTVRRKGGDTRILRATDDLSLQTEARPASGSGIEVTSIPRGQFHQTGTKHMVARKILPDGDELPSTWQEVIDKATENAFKKAMR